ncbi:putative inorganic phosphate cotransporter [Drosophila grimshawi]|uniref:Putative inorganic phosphate cotransporter n=1 Tax=Drosophila grimshawi TaxID=7222 RepID=B4JA19_DROGR|nr:putative inorganic phosphate cotransporter [Drosophila grimshawi]EDW02606.1 GH19799 [Drosophila grimshawi]
MVLRCFECCSRTGYDSIGNTGPRFGVRHLQCILVFFGLAVAYGMRVNLSVAIVAMTDKNATNPDFPEFDWDESIKSYLLSSFFWGYVVTQVPGGYLSSIFGAKYMLFFGVSFCSLLALLTPYFALNGGWKMVILLRAIQGLCQGVIFPSTHTFLSKWAPADERGRLVGYCYSGSQFGTVVMLSVSGYIASSSLGWPSIFYISGGAGILWALIWLYFCASTPAQHATITPNERRYIETSGQLRRASDAGREEFEPRQNLRTPWLSILTSLPFLSLLVAHCANNWGFWTLLTQIPTFMKNVLGMDIKNNGPLSALPYFVMIILTCGFIWLSDVLKRRGSTMSLGFSRKLFNSLGMWLPMLALLGLGFITKGAGNVRLAIVLLCLAVATNSACYLGFHVNHIDLSPNFAGTLMGITNCAANVMSILAPLIVGLIVRDETNPSQWRIVFYITSFAYFFGNLVFIVFGRFNVQSWNSPGAQQERTPRDATGHVDVDGDEEAERAPLIDS